MSEARPSENFYVVRLENRNNDFGPSGNIKETLKWCKREIEAFRRAYSADIPTPIPMGGSAYLIYLTSEKERRELDRLDLKSFDLRDDECYGYRLSALDLSVLENAPLVRRRAWLHHLQRNLLVSSEHEPGPKAQWRNDLEELLEKERREIDQSPEWKQMLGRLTGVAVGM
ncbi:hypothetical protein PISL3812_09937 [Talaromyces islandicus]|uniref:Uncharacterized protein n=1 Tax=Talaromyces islandicus TaxID=28573 RepID=A0A0U1MB77_TALIS|nr:hypothetical protein PISL3812_09937 [Talaromyces islandicus]